MAMFQITCVDFQAGKDSEKSAHEHLAGFGGNAWHASVAAVIDDIESGRNIYYVRKDGRNFLVSVLERGGRKVVRTRDDGRWTDLLLELPACKARKAT